MARSQHTPDLELNCLVLGDDPIKLFTVTIPSSKNVSALREAIKKKEHTFHNVDADTLRLWKVILLRMYYETGC
jgi:hypothetical protein